jgi:hypothetical protein
MKFFNKAITGCEHHSYRTISELLFPTNIYLNDFSNVYLYLALFLISAAGMFT